MHTLKSIAWIAGLSIVTAGLIATPARADRSYSDITGTNIWNNTAPVFDTDTKLDPDLIDRITRVNRDSEQAFDACNAAISQGEQNVPTIRRFARRPATETGAVPVACQQLEELRTEAENLRVTLEEVQRSRSNPAFLTW